MWNETVYCWWQARVMLIYVSFLSSFSISVNVLNFVPNYYYFSTIFTIVTPHCCVQPVSDIRRTTRIFSLVGLTLRLYVIYFLF
jgi:hypothetical protein